jgi:hypothetical protein
LLGYFDNKLHWQYQQLKHKVPLLIPPVLDKALYFENWSDFLFVPTYGVSVWVVDEGLVDVV